jgi:hypothetical protein
MRGGNGGRGGSDLAGFVSDGDMAEAPLPTGGGNDMATPQYTVYAHSDHTLYSIDLMSRTLVTVGPFNAPMVTVGSGSTMAEDVITDLAVAPDGTIYVVSERSLYTADATDGHVTLLGSLSACGQACVALSFLPNGDLYTADYKGAFCKIDTSTSPPGVTTIGTLNGNLAVSGDLVAVDNGTLYATVYNLKDSTTANNNSLATIDPTTATVTSIGATGSPKLFGAAYALGQVFGFTHDGSGKVVTIDPKTGVGTPFGTFTDPSTSKGISFAGAGVNALVPPTPIM